MKQWQILNYTDWWFLHNLSHRSDVNSLVKSAIYQHVIGSPLNPVQTPRIYRRALLHVNVCKLNARWHAITLCHANVSIKEKLSSRMPEVFIKSCFPTAVYRFLFPVSLWIVPVNMSFFLYHLTKSKRWEFIFIFSSGVVSLAVTVGWSFTRPK